MQNEDAKNERAFEEHVLAAGKTIAKPQYTLDELLAQCDANAPPSEEDRAWIDSPSFGKELL
jgi:antitoxin ChpS